MTTKNRHLLLFSCLVVFHLHQVFAQPQTTKNVPKEVDSIERIMTSHFYSGDYYKILEDYDEAMAIVKKHKIVLSERKLITLAGAAFIQVEDTLSAERIFLEAMEVARKQNDENLIALSHFDIGNLYYGAAHEKAIYHFAEALKTVTKLKDTTRIFIANYNIAESYYQNKDYVTAQRMLNTAKPYAKAITERPEFGFDVQYLQGSIYLKTGRFTEAISPLNSVITDGKSYVYSNILIDAHKNLIESYDTLKEYELLNEVRKSYDSLIEIKYKEDKIAQEKKALSKYRLKEIEKELKSQELEKELAQQKAFSSKRFSFLMTAIAIILLLSLALLLNFRRKRMRLLKVLKNKNIQYLEAKEKSDRLAIAKTQFFSTVSHELRTPLYGIIGLAEVLLEKQSLKTHSEELNSLKFSADYLLALVNDVLQINKLETAAGKRLNNEVFSISSLISSIAKSFEFMNQKNQNSIAMDLDADLPIYLESDRMKLSQVLINLIGNACKFTHEGIIKIKVKQLSETNDFSTIRIIIEDDGIGISKEQQKRIFEEFTQFSENSNYQGSGLGLSIVQKLLSLLDSQLEVDSIPSKGSIFSFTIDLKKSNAKIANPKTIKQDVSMLKGLNILIVDDNRINQIVTQKIVEQYQIVHQSAFNGEKAVEAVENGSFDIILMDLNMPIMNGFDASKKIREKNINTPIIALTAVEKNDLDVDLKDFGIDDIVVKPYQTEEFVQKLIEYTLR